MIFFSFLTAGDEPTCTINSVSYTIGQDFKDETGRVCTCISDNTIQCKDIPGKINTLKGSKMDILIHQSPRP